ncbi:Uncharacterized protein Fot_25326 [Forsythia ovata]|uniref:Uncharacterized protein n=1 Tax=Forsythia ovata TaxID=205694 RepID=A0ABD1U9U5_9LAMI
MGNKQVLSKSIPSCFELKCRAYSVLSQCYHLVGAIHSQKQILNKGLELSAISGDGGKNIEKSKKTIGKSSQMNWERDERKGFEKHQWKPVFSEASMSNTPLKKIKNMMRLQGPSYPIPHGLPFDKLSED